VRPPTWAWALTGVGLLVAFAPMPLFPSLVRFAVPLGIGLALGAFFEHWRHGGAKEFARLPKFPDHGIARSVSTTAAEGDQAFVPLSPNTGEAGKKPDDLGAAFRSALLLNDVTDRLIRLRQIVRTLSAEQMPAACAEARRLPFLDQWQVVDLLGSHWADLDLQGALTFSLANGRGAQRWHVNHLLDGVVKRWFVSSSEEAVLWVKNLPAGTDRQQLIGTLLKSSSRTNPAAALELVKSSAMGVNGFEVENLFTEWASRDREGALIAIGELKGQLNEAAVRGAAKILAEDEPAKATEWAYSIKDPAARKEALRQLALMWSDTDPSFVLKWAKDLQDDDVRRDATSQAINRLMVSDFAAAIAELDKIETAEERDQLTTRAAVSLRMTDARGALDLLARIPDTLERRGSIAYICAIWAEAEPRAALDWFFENSTPSRGSHQLVNMMRTWSQRAPEEAVAWVNAITDSDKRDVALGGLGAAVADADPALAQQLFSRASPQGQAAMAQGLTYSMIKRDLESTRAWAESLPPGKAQTAALGIVAFEMATENPVAAAEWLPRLPKGPGRDEAIARFSSAVVRRDPAGALAWAQTISDEYDRYRNLLELTSQWIAIDEGPARKWIQSSPSLTADQRRRLLEQ
jgi:hypothetical protein